MKDVPGWEVSGSADEVMKRKVGGLIVIALSHSVRWRPPVCVGCLTGRQKCLQQPEVPAWGVGCGSMMVVLSLYLLLQQSYQAIISFHSAVHDQLSGLYQGARMGKVTGGRGRWVRRPLGWDWLAGRRDNGGLETGRWDTVAGKGVSHGGRRAIRWACQSLGQARAGRHGGGSAAGRLVSAWQISRHGQCGHSLLVTLSLLPPPPPHSRPARSVIAPRSTTAATYRIASCALTANTSSYAAHPSRGPRIARRSTLRSAPLSCLFLACPIRHPSRSLAVRGSALLRSWLLISPSQLRYRDRIWQHPFEGRSRFSAETL